MQRLTIAHPKNPQEGDISLCYWQAQDKDAEIFHWTHANGFNAETYAPLLSRLCTHAPQTHVYASDLRGAGFTTLPAQPDTLTGWEIYRDDLLALLETLHAKHQKKIWLGGHSMGGYASLYAAATRPDLVAGLVLADPVILPETFGAPAMLLARLKWYLRRNRNRGGGPFHLARLASRRRAHWESREQIRAAYQGRGAFTHWQDGFLDCYLSGGLIEEPTGVRLACAPAWESANYQLTKTNIGKKIANLRVPFTLLLAETGSTTYNLRAFTRAPARKKIMRVKGSTHFIPMEKPDIVEAAIKEQIDSR